MRRINKAIKCSDHCQVHIKHTYLFSYIIHSLSICHYSSTSHVPGVVLAWLGVMSMDQIWILCLMEGGEWRSNIFFCLLSARYVMNFSKHYQFSLQRSLWDMFYYSYFLMRQGSRPSQGDMAMNGGAQVWIQASEVCGFQTSYRV